MRGTAENETDDVAIGENPEESFNIPGVLVGVLVVVVEVRVAIETVATVEEVERHWLTVGNRTGMIYDRSVQERTHQELW